MKKLLSAVFVVLCFFLFASNVFAIDEETYSDIYSSLFSELSDEVIQTIEDFELKDFSYDKFVTLSPRDFISFFIKSINGKISGPLKTTTYILCIILIISAAFSYFPDNEKRKDMLITLGCISVGLIVIPSAFPLIKASMSVIDMTSKFMLCMIPVLIGLISACRNPVMAVSMNSVTLYAANIISSFANTVLTPFMCIFLALCSAGCLSKDLDFSSLALFIKNTVTKVLSLVSSFFISFMTLKGVFTNSVDTLTSKGAKLLISTAVPVIGSSLSEAYFALSGSLSLLKNTVGVTGIIIIFVINLPIILELLIWSTLLSFCVSLCKVMKIDAVSRLLDSISCVFKTLNIILIFIVALFIISTGLMIIIRSNV